MLLTGEFQRQFPWPFHGFCIPGGWNKYSQLNSITL